MLNDSKVRNFIKSTVAGLLKENLDQILDNVEKAEDDSGEVVTSIKFTLMKKESKVYCAKGVILESSHKVVMKDESEPFVTDTDQVELDLKA